MGIRMTRAEWFEQHMKELHAELERDKRASALKRRAEYLAKRRAEYQRRKNQA